MIGLPLFKVFRGDASHSQFFRDVHCQVPASFWTWSWSYRWHSWTLSLFLSTAAAQRSSLSEYRSSLRISWITDSLTLSLIKSTASSMDRFSLIKAMIFPGIRLNGTVMPIRGNHSLAERILFTANIGLFSAMRLCQEGACISGAVRLRPSSSIMVVNLWWMDLNIIMLSLVGCFHCWCNVHREWGWKYQITEIIICVMGEWFLSDTYEIFVARVWDNLVDGLMWGERFFIRYDDHGK